ncbi:alpha/beta fold hydrolase [Vibrio spartinae]|uniref:N-formylmaleamate deformylase n=1 Tax=Vibrio spartinae TaxID=1918945 RepID=A0A1N6M1G6_9VIBR|nr:alpha/beta hydrolase [Vibrio spartinae]QMV15346.1 N-formylmaleamate deformylase [Vibrio spartinae]SIO93217.1 N-formylmaleamate deformylase [Vibrio spartinae]
MTMSSSSHFFTSDGLQLHYLQWGDGNVPVVMLHGLRGFAQTWQDLVDAMGNGFTFFALDQRGRGDSDWGPTKDYHAQTYVQDLARFIDHLGLQRFVLIGHSLGGQNVAEFARQYPERVMAMVIEDIGPGSSKQGEGAERIRREMSNTPLSFDSWQAAQDFWTGSRPNLTEQALQARLTYSFREVDGKITWKHDQQGIAEARLTIEPMDLWPAFRAIACPTLLIKGSHSDFLSSQTVAEIVASSERVQAVQIEHASHYVHDDQPEKFNEAVVRFMQTVLTD